MTGTEYVINNSEELYKTLGAVRTAKEDIKDALSEKGLMPLGGLVKYASLLEEFALGKKFFADYTEYEVESAIAGINKMIIHDANRYNENTSIGRFENDNPWDEFGPHGIVFCPKVDADDMYRFCYLNEGLSFVPALNCSNTTDVRAAFYGCINLYWIEGFNNLGACSDLVGTETMINNCRNLCVESVDYIANSVYDLNQHGSDVSFVMKLPEHLMGKISTHAYLMFVNKGWSIAF